MAISSVIKNFRNGTIKLEDGTGSPITLTVQYESGDFKGTGFLQGQIGIVAYLDRGDFSGLRKQNFTPVSGSFSAHMTDLADGTEKNLIDAVRKAGAFAAGVSTSGTNADVWTLDITWTVEGTDFGDASDHVLKLEDCHCTIDVSEGDPNSFTISFTCYGTITTT